MARSKAAGSAVELHLLTTARIFPARVGGIAGGEGLGAYWKEHSDVPPEEQRRDDAPIDPQGEPGGPFLEFVMAILRAAGDDRTPAAVLKAIQRAAKERRFP
jgi:hypothetical protein